ncbi:MAG TPA: hypothetical protein VFE28_14460 [Candidatus Krumholzibacteria bacterium]|jgi:hypothetical protein|nr:hypothetical protein [Candidatus Krumholzibacteria bacterium]
MRKVVRVSSLLAILVLALAGCSKPPTVEIEAAKAAMAEATKAEAEAYAPEAMQSARSATSAYEEEVKLQEGKFALFRKYDKAKTMVAEATTAAQTAATQAVENKNRIRQEVTSMIGESRTMLTEAQGMLEKAPRGKGTTLDLQVMGSDLTAAGTAIDEAQALLDQDKLMEARTKVQAANSTIASVKSSIEQAIQMKAAAKK